MFDDDKLDYIVEQSMQDLAKENKKYLENTPFSTWLVDDDEYTPAVNIKKVNKLPSGVFKVSYSDDNYRISKINLNSDEIFIFSKNYTEKILKEIDSFLKKADLYKNNSLIHKRGMLLSGPPGGGKTSVITLLINQLIKNNGIVFLVNNYKDFSILNECLSPVIRKIEQSRPIITVIEDVDKLLEENNENDAELLDFLDGRNSIDHHIVIMTSNNTSSLSSALLRPSRIDMHFEILNPDYEIRKEYFEKKGLCVEDIDKYVECSEGMSFAQLKELFIGTCILGKDLVEVADQLNNPFGSKDYLTTNNKSLGY